MARSKLDVLSIQNQLMIAYPEIAWISLNTKGSSVTIRIGEKKISLIFGTAIKGK